MGTLLALTHFPTLLLAVVFMFAMGAAVWALLGWRLRLMPQASGLLALANLLLAVALATDALRGGAGPAWLAYWGSDVLGIAGFVVLRAAVPVVGERPAAWRLGVAVLLLGAVALLFMPYRPPLHRHVALVFGCMSLLCVVASLDAWRLLRRELRRPAALGLLSPLLLVSGAVALRFGHALLRPQQTAGLNQASDFNTAWVWLALLLCLLLNAAMAFLILLRLVLRIQRLTRRDPLTDVLNRRAFAERLALAHAGLARERPYALLLLDLDHFKPLNDGLGHAAGDAALTRVAGELRGALRGSDELGRLGGEEFGVLLPLTDLAGARVAAERLRRRLEQLPFEWQGRPWPISASIGLSIGRPEDADGEVALARADAAMYAAKAAGRNCVREA